MLKPYYSDDAVTLYHGDCREVPGLERVPTVVTDSPYPNNAGHFDDAVDAAREVLTQPRAEVLAFWSELEFPPVPLPLVAVHIWHRSNVNGRPYEPVFHFSADGVKRRSEVMRHPAVFFGAGPGCNEYLGHPTQKPVALMRQLISRTKGDDVLLDPFAGSGSTLRAAKDLGRKAIGVETNEAYCEIAARRLSQGVLAFGESA